MDSTLISIIAAISSAMVSLIVCILTLRFNYKNLHAEIVSKSRNDWTECWKNNISKFIALCEILRYEKQNIKDYVDLLEKYHIAKNEIMIRLNMNEDKHQQIYILINQISYGNNVSNEEFSRLKELLYAISRSILKEEWERVKIEAKGKK